MSSEHGDRRARWLVIPAIVLGVLVLVGVGVAVGVSLHSGPSSPHRGGSPGNTTLAIDMSKATSISCLGPVAPGPAHPDRVVTQLFHVSDSNKTAYQVGWVVVPYKGTGKYTFGSGGDVLALQHATGGTILGYGKGTVTFIGSAKAGKIDATVELRKGGGTVTIDGSWLCATAAG